MMITQTEERRDFASEPVHLVEGEQEVRRVRPSVELVHLPCMGLERIGPGLPSGSLGPIADHPGEHS